MAIQASDRLSLTFAALADPTRRAILARLVSGDADVSEIGRPFDLSQPTISKHLKVLERAGLITGQRNAQRRPRSLAAAPLREVAGWVDDYRQFWEGQFASLDTYLANVSPNVKTSNRKDSKHGNKRSKK